ncbi:MAG TPA: indole-3-glycerol phosphate synthase TrpC [Ilumatobacteraceae bacterium]|nr:indole-3-glycerol phosphate synthase TrpC [Ilumatobacteraceae bacterium]
MTTYLDRIVERHRELTADDTRTVATLVAEAASMPATRGFRRALAESGGLAVIAEIKRRSPSKGDLNAALDPADLARAYERGGASCLSVLTDQEFFGGSPSDLRTARAACSLPVLRKDFTVSVLDVADARLMGADCVLLIAAALEPGELAELHGLAIESGLDVLVEVHDEAELDVALAAGATLIGVNQRDLTTFEVDHQRALRMAGVIPADVVKVAESGIRGGEDARALRDAGYDAILVGETLVTSGDPARTIGELLT